MNIPILTPSSSWKDYELIDAGNLEKIERFGNFILIRPEQQAVWNKRLPEKEWQQLAHAKFSYGNGKKGNWKQLKKLPNSWLLNFKEKNASFQLQLKQTAFKHVGVFPEQAPNWSYINQTINNLPVKNPKVLNLFAYTGAASLAASSSGANVTHVDSIKQVVNWANENAQLSQINNIRWTVEDAFKFVKREAKRGNKYHGIIMDPPTFGLGPKGQKWKLEELIDDLVKEAISLLEPQHHFFILNTYSLGFSPVVIKNIIESHYKSSKVECGMLGLNARSGVVLPMSFFARFSTV